MPVWGKKRKQAFRPFTSRKRTKKWPESKTRALATKAKLAPSRGLYGLPDEFTTRLRYVDVYTLSSVSGAIAKQVMRLNGLFDPDFTGTGHQPYYFDQLAALYGRYCVIGSKLTAEFSQIANAIATAQPAGPMLVGVTADTDGTIGSTLSTLLETSGVKTCFMGNQIGGNNVKVLTCTFSPERDLGVSVDDDTVSSAVTTNPSAQFFGGVFMSEQGTATPTAVMVKIQVEYYVKFSRVTEISGS